MYYVGVDLHKETAWFYVVNASGSKIMSTNVAANPESLKKFFAQIPKPFQVAVEATYNWYYFMDIAEQCAQKVFLANSYELKAFAKRHKKTDKIDARLIATVLQKGYLPTVTIANKHTRQVRELLRYKMKLVVDRSRNIFRLKALLDKLGYQATGDYTTGKALDAIDTTGLAEIYGGLVQKYSNCIKDLTKRIYAIKNEINALSEYDIDMYNLLSIPGLGAFSAALIKSEIIDIHRFKSFNRLCAYAGLAPRVSASAQKVHHGALNINRRKYLQWILLENVHHFIRADIERTNKFERAKKRKGYNTAKVSFAREFLKIIYHVLKEKRQYYKNKEKNKIQSVMTTALIGV